MAHSHLPAPCCHQNPMPTSPNVPAIHETQPCVCQEPHPFHTGACGRDYFLPAGAWSISDSYPRPFQIHRHKSAITHHVGILKWWNGGMAFSFTAVYCQDLKVSFLCVLRMEAYVRASSVKTVALTETELQWWDCWCLLCRMTFTFIFSGKVLKAHFCHSTHLRSVSNAASALVLFSIYE